VIYAIVPVMNNAQRTRRSGDVLANGNTDAAQPKIEGENCLR